MLSVDYSERDLTDIKRGLDGLWPEDVMLLDMSILSGMNILSDPDFDRLRAWSRGDVSSEISMGSLPEELGVVSTAHGGALRATSHMSSTRESDQASNKAETWTLKFYLLQEGYDAAYRARVQVFTPCRNVQEDKRALQALKNKLLLYQETGAANLPNATAVSAFETLHLQFSQSNIESFEDRNRRM